ncbi:peptidyl-prolyl cis-trans isomerase [Lysinibacillus sp. BW-2-10]|uniref:peptidyl-prolyl cis-trans isomerase n=1 Tax=Lysinibacillus sp. BW-2-10 TaxID=2590030 RepID=UPI00117E38BA|nr:peptidyl-prolyl cis-trans isomerase [Lysinibacillus sp. BW-2-10]TSI09313.1 peptidyl-prolyl cis-trans isomerase [Lysinibacillus sp. BW-2-10]
MENIIPIKGAVKYSITIDPTVWIFDDRRLDLNTYFINGKEEEDQDLAYLKNAGSHWSREIMEGATFPPTLKTERKFDRQGMKTGTFGMEIKHFLKNAELDEQATRVVLELKDGNEQAFSVEEANTLIFKYSQDGKPITDGGPVHVLYADGSNVDNPIKNVAAIRVD